MKTLIRTDSVSFTTKGQVVIPARLRRQFHIENGTRAIVQATEEGILLKPITSVSIRRLRGMLKRKPGESTLTEEWSEHKRQEREMEDAEHGRHHRS